MSLKRTGEIPTLANDKIMQTIVIDALYKLGLIGVKWAIQHHEFHNRSNNLEDSYGFAIYHNGGILGQPFLFDKNATKMVEIHGKKYSGYREGKNFLLNFKPSTHNYTLVVTAGLIYASFVEEYYGLDVLQSSYLEVRKQADNVLKNLKWNKIQ